MTKYARRRRSQTTGPGPASSGLSNVLREARVVKGLSQKEVAARLGLHQRQISDLERSKVDTRLSTLQNVARALDLELVLIPRRLISTVEGLQHSEPASAAGRPLYSLEEKESPVSPPRRSKGRT